MSNAYWGLDLHAPNEMQRKWDENITKRWQDLQTPREHDMALRTSWKHRDNAHRTEKPIVSVAHPQGWLDLRQSAVVGMQLSHHMSLSTHFQLDNEPAPWTYDLTNWECVRLIGITANVFYGNWAIGRGFAGSMFPLNSRTRWAHAIVGVSGIIRLNLFGVILGAGGYFYSLEFLTTYVKPFRMNDPSPEGWKCGYREGQSCYKARAVAAMFPALGYALARGSVKKAGNWWGFLTFMSLYWECGRCYNLPSNLQMLHAHLVHIGERTSRLGNFVPHQFNDADPDTGKLFNVANNPVDTFGRGSYQKVRENNCNHDMMPGHMHGYFGPNPYYNPKKAAQGWDAAASRFNADRWTLPHVLSPRMLSGALD